MPVRGEGRTGEGKKNCSLDSDPVTSLFPPANSCALLLGTLRENAVRQKGPGKVEVQGVSGARPPALSLERGLGGQGGAGVRRGASDLCGAPLGVLLEKIRAGKAPPGEFVQNWRSGRAGKKTSLPRTQALAAVPSDPRSAAGSGS